MNLVLLIISLHYDEEREINMIIIQKEFTNFISNETENHLPY